MTAEAYLELSGTSVMELFVKLVNSFTDKKKKENPIIDVRLDPKQDT